MSTFQHAVRIALLLAGTAALLGWVLRHTEASSADGLRYIRQAERIEKGEWREGLLKSIDHPLHPLGIVAAHRLVGGDGPVSWQRAAVALAYGSLVLLVIPLYMLTRESFGEQAAWLGCVLVVTNPVLGTVAANALSESSFLLFWAWGLWAALRFLREGRFIWLPLSIGFGILAYLSRPEGLLLPLGIVGSLLVLPLHRSTRINWPRWWGAVGFLVAGSLLLAGPFMILKGGPGTKPGVARVLGLIPASDADALEREQPLPPDQTGVETYRLATLRMIEVVVAAVDPSLFPLALLGLAVNWPTTGAKVRIWLLFGIILAASAIGLTRLHATGGYCTTRNALAPALILILAAANGFAWLMRRVSLPLQWFGLKQQRLRPGPAVWGLVILLLYVGPRINGWGPSVPGPFNIYRDTGAWLARYTSTDDQILDLTDWALYFSGRPGYRFAHVYEAPADPRTRWIVVSRPQLLGDRKYSEVLRDLVGQRDPAVLIPANPGPGQSQIQIYDRFTLAPEAVSTASNDDGETRSR